MNVDRRQLQTLFCSYTITQSQVKSKVIGFALILSLVVIFSTSLDNILITSDICFVVYMYFLLRIFLCPIRDFFNIFFIENQKMYKQNRL